MTEKQLIESVLRLSRKYVAHKFYSDDEERDDHGRWSGGGDSSEGGEKGTIGGKAIGDVIKERQNSPEGKAEIKSIQDKMDKMDDLHKSMKDMDKKMKSINGLIKRGGPSADIDKLRAQHDDLLDKRIAAQTEYAKLGVRKK